MFTELHAIYLLYFNINKKDNRKSATHKKKNAPFFFGPFLCRKKMSTVETNLL